MRESMERVAEELDKLHDQACEAIRRNTGEAQLRHAYRAVAFEESVKILRDALAAVAEPTGPTCSVRLDCDQSSFEQAAETLRSSFPFAPTLRQFYAASAIAALIPFAETFHIAEPSRHLDAATAAVAYADALIDAEAQDDAS